MPNIFDGLKKVSDKDLIEQIALLETINIVNISKPIAQKAKKNTISILNLLGSKFGKKQILRETEVKEIWILVDERKEELLDFTRPELEDKLIEVIMAKLKNPIEYPTEEEISIEVIEEASKLYKIKDTLTPGYKADNIYLKYMEKKNEREGKYINEQELIDLKETTELVEDSLSDMQKNKNTENAIDIESFTLLNAWRNVDRQLFARIVWLAVKACGGKFTPDKNILPSYIDEEKDIERLSEEQELKTSQNELSELENTIEMSKGKINTIENSLEEKSRLLNKSKESKKQIEEELINLKEMNIKLEEIKKLQEDKIEEIKSQMEDALLDKLDLLMEEFKKVKFDSIDINNKISDISMDISYKNESIKSINEEIKGHEETINKIGSEVQEFKLESNELLKAYNEKKEEVNKKEECFRKQVFDRWVDFYSDFLFEFQNLKNIAKFTRDELIHVEECLYELHFTNDPKAFSMGIIEDKNLAGVDSENQYLDASFPDKFNIEIQYKILENHTKKVQIVEITNEF